MARSISVSTRPRAARSKHARRSPMPSTRWRESHSFIVIDTPGHDGSLSRLAHSMADTLITPLNDSFVDFDVLGRSIRKPSRCPASATTRKWFRRCAGSASQHDGGSIDWLVMRNRLSMLGTRNKRLVGAALRGAIAQTGVPHDRRLRRADDLPRVLSARADGARRLRRGHARHAAHHVACHGAPGGGEPAEQHQSRLADGLAAETLRPKQQLKATATRLDGRHRADAVPDFFVGWARRESPIWQM